MDFNINVVTINVNGIKARLKELTIFLSSLNRTSKNSIIILTDTRLHALSKNIKIDGYTIIRQDKPVSNQTRCRYSAGGIAFVIPSEWGIHELDSLTSLSNEKTEAKLIIVFPPGCEPIKLAGCYNHPGNHFHIKHLGPDLIASLVNHY